MSRAEPLLGGWVVEPRWEQREEGEEVKVVDGGREGEMRKDRQDRQRCLWSDGANPHALTAWRVWEVELWSGGFRVELVEARRLGRRL